MHSRKAYRENNKEIVFYKEKPLKTLLALYKNNYNRLIKAVVCFFLKHMPVWVLPIVTTNIINIISSGGENQLKRIAMNVGVMAGLILINIPINMLFFKYVSTAVRQVESDVRMNLVKKLQILSISYHKQLQTGRIQAKVLRDVEAITNLSMQLCLSIIPIILNLIVTFTITISKNGSVALFFVCSIPGCFLLVRGFRKKIRFTNRDFRKNIEDMSATVAQMVEMVPITRAHALEEVEIERVDQKIESVRKTGQHIDVLNAFLGSCAWCTFQILQIGCLMFTGYLAYKGDIQIGDIVLYQSYFSTILSQVSAVINIYPEVVKGFESINSVGEIFLASDVEENEGKKVLGEVHGNYRFEDISFKYEDSIENVLEGFNLEVKEGESIAFVGESGGGKTTLLNLLIGFISPTKGTIYLDGEDMTTLNMRAYREQIAVVPQNTILFSGSIRENIIYGMENVTERQLSEAIEAAYLTEVIANLPNGIETKVGEHGDMLSGGQKQRIAIARALIRDPKIIILDEATSALDNQAELHIQGAMKNLSKGRTTFIVAHRLSTIVDCDRIVVVSEGKVAEEGSYRELIERQGAFYELATTHI